MENRAALRGKIKAASKDIDSAFDNQNPAVKGNIDRPLEIGDVVKIIKLDKEATVLERPQSGKVILQAGIMKVTVNIEDLELVEGKKQNKNKTDKYVSRKNFDIKNREVITEIDVRGYNSEQAIYDIDKFIDQAVLLNLTKLQIIHGKGTGVLRSAVHSHLRGHKAVSSFRLGTYGEGESGITIVELK